MSLPKAILTPEQLTAFTQANPHWRLTGNELTREWTFPDFPTAIAFVNHVADLAQAANHHPDIDIRYNRVRLALASHDAGGITTRDTNLAQKLNTL